MAKSGELAHGADPEAEPSAEWGWHGTFPRGMLVAGWASVVMMLAFTVGNHGGNVENIWLVGVAGVMAYSLVRHSLARRHAWRR
ncbi:MAG: DUF2631 domain-containing protein [Pseudonocardia sp.]